MHHLKNSQVFIKRTLLVSMLSLIAQFAISQTCTITVSGDWDTRTCNETGLAPVSGDLIVIPVGVIVSFSTNIPDPKHTGDFEISGKLEINKDDVRIDGNITVKNGGELEISKKLRIGTDDPNCGKTLSIESGGVLTFPGTGSNDKLFICGSEVARAGGAGCNPYPDGPIPYCEPAGGFTGPFVFGENGLPVTLLYFNVNAEPQKNILQWATSSEVDFNKFIIQRSTVGVDFEDIGEVAGQGRNIYEIISIYSFEDKAPLLGYNYYRLKALDLDNSFEYFDVKAAQVKGVKMLTAYPNPGSGEAISFITNFNPAEGDRIKLVNTFGQQLLTMKVLRNDNVIRTAERLSPGVYFLQYIGSEYKETLRIVIQK